MGFTYECYINNQKIKEATEGVAHNQDMVFKVGVDDDDVDEDH
jgi:hypothetical protein